MANKKKVEKPKTTKKEPKVVPQKPIVKKVTLKEKIDRTVEDYKDNPEELKKQLFGLVQRVLYPDQFCPDCNDRLFFNGQAYSCTNCGYERNAGIAAPTSNPTPTVATRPGARPPETTEIPKQVEDIIKQSKEDMKDVPRRGGTTKMGAQIQKLVAERDAGGPQVITPQDEAAVRRDANTSNKINWV